MPGLVRCPRSGTRLAHSILRTTLQEAETMRGSLYGTAFLAMFVFSGSAAAQNSGREQMRFKNMDQNADGRITREEWRGSPRAFDVHDWNHDGVLSGDEIRVNGGREAVPQNDVDLDTIVREHEFDDWTARGFAALDRNRD